MTLSGPTVSEASAVLDAGGWPGTVTVAFTTLFAVAPPTSEAPVVRFVERWATSTHCAEAAPIASIVAPVVLV